MQCCRSLLQENLGDFCWCLLPEIMLPFFSCWKWWVATSYYVCKKNLSILRKRKIGKNLVFVHFRQSKWLPLKTVLFPPCESVFFVTLASGWWAPVMGGRDQSHWSLTVSAKAVMEPSMQGEGGEGGGRRKKREEKGNSASFFWGGGGKNAQMSLTLIFLLKNLVRSIFFMV